MALNEILHDEQITIMQLAAATTQSGSQGHRHELGRLAGKLSLFAYPHRPYVQDAPGAPAPADADETAGIR